MPNGRHWGSGMVAIIMHSGCDAVGSHYVAPACPNDCRGGADCAQASITSARPCAWQPTRAANLRARMPHVFWASAAVVVPSMLLYLILSESVEVNPNSLARRLGAMPLTFARAAPLRLAACQAQHRALLACGQAAKTLRAATEKSRCTRKENQHPA